MNSGVKPRTYNSPLRAEQAAATQRRILDAAVDHLAASGREDLTIGEVAKLAGVSERTVYNHFGSFDDLLDAVAAHLEEVVLPDPPFDDADSLVESVRNAWRLTADQERVLRALSTLAARTQPARYARVLAVLEPLVAGLDDRDARVALAGLFAVRGASAYLTLRDQHGASSEEAADAMAWLLSVGIQDLRDRNEHGRLHQTRGGSSLHPPVSPPNSGTPGSIE